MFTTLLESKARKTRSPGGMVVSAVFHGLVLFAAIRATLHASQPEKTAAPVVQLIDVKKDAPPPRPRELHLVPAARGPMSLTVPLVIPDVLPEIDLSRAPTTDDDFRDTTAPRGGAGHTSGTAPAANHTFAEYEVEKPAMSLAGSPGPRYPDILKAAGVEGDVMLSFVVDTTGRVDLNHVVVLKSSHPLFEAAVRSALPAMRFVPAEVGGRKVRQLVQQPFVFHIIR